MDHKGKGERAKARVSGPYARVKGGGCDGIPDERIFPAKAGISTKVAPQG